MAGLKIDFRVHNITNVPQRAQVELNGEKISASVDCLEVELVTASDNFHGTFTARFHGADAARARKLFKVDSIHSWVLEK